MIIVLEITTMRRIAIWENHGESKLDYFPAVSCSAYTQNAQSFKDTLEW